MQRLNGGHGIEVVREGGDDGRVRLACSVAVNRPFRQQMLGLLQPLDGEVDRLAVMGHQHRQPKHLARPFAAAEFFRVKKLVDGDEIALGLRHLAAFDLQEAVVHPDIRHHLGAVGATRLGDLVLVMRENQVDAAAVDVEDVAEIAPAHRRAFDVPAGSPATPGAIPARLVLGGELPEHEIARVFLVRFDGDAGTGLLLVEIALGELAVIVHRPRIEEDFPSAS